jgi:hypothetical protein
MHLTTKLNGQSDYPILMQLFSTFQMDKSEYLKLLEDTKRKVSKLSTLSENTNELALFAQLSQRSTLQNEENFQTQQLINKTAIAETLKKGTAEISDELHIFKREVEIVEVLTSDLSDSLRTLKATLSSLTAKLISLREEEVYQETVLSDQVELLHDTNQNLHSKIDEAADQLESNLVARKRIIKEFTETKTLYDNYLLYLKQLREQQLDLLRQIQIQDADKVNNLIAVDKLKQRKSRLLEEQSSLALQENLFNTLNFKSKLLDLILEREEIEVSLKDMRNILSSLTNSVSYRYSLSLLISFFGKFIFL